MSSCPVPDNNPDNLLRWCRARDHRDTDPMQVNQSPIDPDQICKQGHDRDEIFLFKI